YLHSKLCDPASATPCLKIGNLIKTDKTGKINVEAVLGTEWAKILTQFAASVSVGLVNDTDISHADIAKRFEDVNKANGVSAPLLFQNELALKPLPATEVVSASNPVNLTTYTVDATVETPVISMFLASAYGFETGPYSEGNLVLQPVIGCGPCNPNKSCGRPDCHEMISPQLVAYLTMARLAGDVLEVSEEVADPRLVTVYRSSFDEQGFYNLVPLNTVEEDSFSRYRAAYRKLWLDDLGGFHVTEEKRSNGLRVLDEGLDGLREIRTCAQHGQELIKRLEGFIEDVSAPAARLGEVSQHISELDSKIERLGFQFGPLESLTRMFVFAKENLKGSDPMGLASQMNSAYQDLERRCSKFGSYYLAG
ncbi:MAG: hypothetical protein WCN89_00360, partial [bacterium]